MHFRTNSLFYTVTKIFKKHLDVQYKGVFLSKSLLLGSYKLEKVFSSMALYDVIKGGNPCMGIYPGRLDTSTGARARAVHQRHRQRCTVCFQL